VASGQGGAWELPIAVRPSGADLRHRIRARRSASTPVRSRRWTTSKRRGRDWWRRTSWSRPGWPRPAC